MTTMMIFNYITDYRVRQVLTQKEVADGLGWTLRKVQSYEQGWRMPSVEDAVRLARFLGVTVEQLYPVK